MTSYTVKGGGGLNLNVEATGNPRGKPILFIHGFSHCRLQWNKQLHSDLARDFYLVSMDLRGHGLSDKPPDAYSDSKLWADDVHAVIATLELDHPVLSAWTYGGAVVTDYIRFYGEDAIAGTNWVGAVCRLGAPLFNGGFLGTQLQSLMTGYFSDDMEESVEKLQEVLRLCSYAELTPEDLYFFLGYHMIVPTYVRRAVINRDLNADDVVASLRKPVLLTHGEEDAVIMLSMSRHIANLAKQARLSLYPKVGHLPMWEAPERFNRELREFRETI